MSARRGATDLSGVLAIDKPGGCTSHDVVDHVRRVTGERRVGHSGTLDPMASGLLVVLVGPATRLAPFLTSAKKTYQARIVFGCQTDTDDADGLPVVTASVPDEVADPFFATGIISSLIGPHEQVPPTFSAVKIDGKTAYRSARSGDPLTLPPRTIEVFGARLVGIEWAAECAWDVEFTVSKGTYVRALARDLGLALGTVAHLGALRRTRCGTVDVDAACSLDALDETSDVSSLFTDPLEALGLRAIELDSAASAVVAHGAPLDSATVDGLTTCDGLVALSHEGRLLGVYEPADGRFVARCVIPGGVARAERSIP